MPTIPFAAYSLGGEFLTFWVMMVLFVIVVATLFSVFRRTNAVPGHDTKTLRATPGPAPMTAAVTDTASTPEGGGAAPSPGPAPVTAEEHKEFVANDPSQTPPEANPEPRSDESSA